MFGINYIKAQPTTYLMQYSNGTIKRQGAGLSFCYFAPTTSLVAVPLESNEIPFIFAESTADHQEITVQGYVTYRIAEPEKIAALLNFSLSPNGRRYLAEDAEKLPQRILQVIQVQVRGEVQKRLLRQALVSSDEVGDQVFEAVCTAPEIIRLGLEILGVSILAVKPAPETARALEAEAREQLLLEADEAIYSRRKAAVEQERAVKESELNTEIAVEKKKRQVKEEKMAAEKSVQRMRSQIMDQKLEADIDLEEKRKALVERAGDNAKTEADAKEYALAAVVKPLAKLDTKTLQSLASVGMNPSQLIAQSFQSMAENADKIGQLNVSPDLLRELMEDRSQYGANN
ncbi:MAG: SPFH domain-containing protein [Thermodesulfobacteriota bacterium]